MSKETSVGEHKRLLLIDDDPNLILLVKDYLEFRGYEVITAENGQDALELLDNETPDMIICDVMMPQMDGYSLVENVRKILAQAGFQFYSYPLKGRVKIG
ncbi:MAG: response regulator [Leptolyngbya sp. IPPAS B-1204]